MPIAHRGMRAGGFCRNVSWIRGEEVKNWISRMFSDGAGIPDEARVVGVALAFLMAYLAISQRWDAQSFAVGIGAYAASIGGWLRLRGNN